MTPYDEARAEGWSDTDIAAHFAPKVEAARAEGYSDKEIGDYMQQRYGVPNPDVAKANTSLAKSVSAAVGRMGQTVTDVSSLYAPVEAALNVATGVMFGFPMYLGAGMGTLAARGMGMTDEDPKVIASRFSEAVTYKPMTERGQRLTAAATLPFTSLMEGSEKAGQAVSRVTGSAGAGALTEATLQMLPAPLISALGRGLAGKTPKPGEFHDAATVLTESRAAEISQKLQETYEKTGVDPVTVVKAAETDPTIIQDLASTNREVPAALNLGEFSTVAGEEIGGVSHLKGIVEKLQKVYIEQGRDAGRAMLEDMAENAPESSGFSKEVKAAGFIDELDAELSKRAKEFTESRQPTLEERVAAGIREDEGLPPPEEAAPPAPPSEPPPPRPPESPPPNGDQQAILDRIVPGESKHKWPTLHELYTKVIDSLNPLKLAEKEATGGERLPTGESPYDLERLMRGLWGKGLQFIRYGAYDFNTYRTIGKSYEKILEPVKNDLDGFRAYIVAKRAIEQEGKGLETGIPLDAARRIVSEGAGRYEQVHQDRLNYRQALLDYLNQSGVLSNDGYARIQELNKDYVPFYRFFEEEGGRPSSAKRVRNPVKEFKGSERQIIDPVESDIKDTFLFISLAEKNAARQKFVRLGPEFAEKVKQPIMPVNLTDSEIRAIIDEFVNVQQRRTIRRTETTVEGQESAPEASGLVTKNRQRVKDALEARGFSGNESEIMINRLSLGKASDKERIIKEVETNVYEPSIDIRLPNEVATIFRARSFTPAPDEIAVFFDGKREVYKVDPEVATAFNGMDRQGASFLANMLNAPASLLRAGITLSPDFAARNMVRDAVSAFIYTTSHPVKTIKGAISYLGKDEAFQNWLKGGGANATMVAIDRNYIQNHLFQLSAEVGAMQKTWNIVKAPIEILRIMSETMENVTRLGAVRDEMLAARDKATVQALSMISREATVDFARRGSDPFLQSYTRMTAFMNPGIQGLDRMVRSFKENPVGTSARAFASITLPSLLLWWANHDDPRWKEIPDWQRDLFWIVMTKDHIYRIPKDFQWGIVFGSLPERILDKYFADKPDAFHGFAKNMATGLQFNVMPTFAVPALEQMTNYSFFQDRPLIPQSLEGILPEYQYMPYTTEETKAIGRIIGKVPAMKTMSIASPLVIDNYIRGWSGTLGTYAVQLSDLALRKSGMLPDEVKPTATLADMPVIKAFMVRYPSAQAQSIGTFHERYNDAKKIGATINYLVKQMEPDKALAEVPENFAALVKLDGINEGLNNAQRMIQLIYANKKFTADEKRQLIDTTYYQMIQMASEGNKALDQLKRTLH